MMKTKHRPTYNELVERYELLYNKQDRTEKDRISACNTRYCAKRWYDTVYLSKDFPDMGPGRRLSYSEIIEKFMGTPNKRVAWQYKNTARERYSNQFSEDDFIRPVKFLGDNIPHSRRTYEELVTMFADPKYGSKTLVRKHAIEYFPIKFKEEDFPHKSTRASYQDIVAKYKSVISGKPTARGNYSHTYALRKKAHEYYPHEYKEEDFPSRWNCRKYRTHTRMLTYERIVKKYMEIVMSDKKTHYHSALKKLASNRYPDQYQESDFPSKKDVKHFDEAW